LLTKAIYEVTRQGQFARDFALAGQMQRAAVSIMSNLAEGFERSRLTEFHQYTSVAKASCGELRSQLYIALDIAYISKERWKDLYTQTTEVGKIIGGLRASIELRQSRKRNKTDS
jgi:four helix bundle protein